MKSLSTKDFILMAMFAAMLAVASVFVIPIGPVPITLQVFFFLLIPSLLGAFKGFMTISLYLMLGLIGLPVFAGGTQGFQALLSPSFGYLIGSLAVALYLGSTIKPNHSYIRQLAYMTGAIGILYLFGITYQYFIMNVLLETPLSLKTILITNMSVFFPIDLIKALFACTVYRRLNKIVIN